MRRSSWAFGGLTNLLRGASSFELQVPSLPAQGRFVTRPVTIGSVVIGAANPIAVQTMLSVSTRDVAQCYDQTLRARDAGAVMIRLAVQGAREVVAAEALRSRLDAAGVELPLVADIHFSPSIALRAADVFDKVRINPGNFTDGIKSWAPESWTDASWAAAQEKLRETVTPLIRKLKGANKALRIGVNSGSVSGRVLWKFGDTARGLVESAFEVAEICRKEDFHQIVFSVKSSSLERVIEANRVLGEMQRVKGWNYPLHVGVTEAGEGVDGRLRSALGVGAILDMGLGDTVRISPTLQTLLALRPRSLSEYLANRSHLPSCSSPPASSPVSKNPPATLRCSTATVRTPTRKPAACLLTPIPLPTRTRLTFRST